MRTRWNPEKQCFEAICSYKKAAKRSRPKRRKPPAGQKGRGWNYKGENNLDYKGKRSQMNVLIPDDLLIALKRHHRSVCENISFNDYMSKVVEAHLQSLELAYDYSDPDLATYIESLQYD